MSKLLFLLFFFLLSLITQSQISENWSSIEQKDFEQKIKVDSPDDFRFVLFSGKLESIDQEIPRYRVWVEGTALPWSSFYMDDHSEQSLVFRSPVFKQRVEYIEVKSNTNHSFELNAYSPSSSKVLTYKRTSGSVTCSCPMPAFIDRDVWCQSNCPIDTTPEVTFPTHFIVHHTADVQFNDTNTTNYNDVMDLYYNFHTSSNGWDDIGYNWLIDPTGKIYKGRSSGLKGAHFSCMNDNTVGIALIGNYENDAPSPLMMEALISLLTWETCDKGVGIVDEQFHIGSELELRRVSGHNDGNPSLVGCPVGTLCPGNFVHALLDSVLNEVSMKPCLIDSTKDLYYDLAMNNAMGMVFNPGEEVMVSATLKSYGNGYDSLNYKMGIYISLDDSLEPSDILIQSDSLNYLVDTLGFAYNELIEIPDTTLPGTYHLFFKIDAPEQIIELDEVNNVYGFEIELAYPVGLSQNLREKEIYFYPNPTRGEFTSTLKANEMITLYNENGKLLYRGRIGDLSLEKYPKGMYWIVFKNESRKIIKL